MTKSTEEQPAAVSAKTIRAREILRLIVQVEPKVWTERMLTALVQGVKGGKWFSLIDKVHPERTLEAAFSQVAANQGAAGVDHVTIAMFETRLDEELRRLSFTGRMGTTLGDQWVPPERLRRVDCSTTLGIKPVRRLDSRPLRDCRADQGRIDSLSGPGPMFR